MDKQMKSIRCSVTGELKFTGKSVASANGISADRECRGGAAENYTMSLKLTSSNMTTCIQWIVHTCHREPVRWM